MKREAKLLLAKSTDSLILGIELFNRPIDRGRSNSVLILLDHSFEMLLKSSILHRGGKIREKRATETIGFDACVRRSLSDGQIKFLTEEQALVLQSINGLRDAAQHHLLDISEGQLYFHIQSGVTLFRDILKDVFDLELITRLPTRVLPVSTDPPTDLVALFDSEIEAIKKLLQPGRRRQTEALARLRPLAILNGAIHAEKGQPSDLDLRRIGKEIISGEDWKGVFQGVAAIAVVAEGDGPNLSIRFSKREGIPVHLVEEGTPDASVVAVRRVDELSFYNLNSDQLAQHVGLTRPKVLAVVEHIDLRSDQDCFKEFQVGKSPFKRYSQRAIRRVEKTLQKEKIEDIWRHHLQRRKARSAS